MRIRFDDTLGYRAEQAGLLFAAGNAPLTFQRTLVERSTVDQALITGLSMATNSTIVTVLQEAIQAAARVALVPGGTSGTRMARWSRAAIAADVAAYGAGIVLQRKWRAHPREPLPRAALRTGGFFLSVAGAAGAMVGALQERGANRPARRTVPLIIPATGAIAAAVEFRRRRAERLDADLPAETMQVSAGRAFALGLGVTGSTLLMGAAERASAEVIGRTLGRALPGGPALWRLVGHVATLGALAGLTRFGIEHAYASIEHKETAVEAAFDIPPPAPLSSGSLDSRVDFATLSRQGRRFAWTPSIPARINDVMGGDGAVMPVRTYVGLESAATPQKRVELAIEELERTNAFARPWLMVDVPTGTGYVNPIAVGVFEMLTCGNCATVALQYAARPSVLSLDRVAEGRLQSRLLLDAIHARLLQQPAERRPKLVLFGESLGAWSSQDAFVGLGTYGLDEVGVDYAIWIGTPHFSKWKEQVLFDGRTDVDPATLGVFNDIDEYRTVSEEARRKLRYVMITHHDDGVAQFGPELFIQSPPWLGSPNTRPSGVPKGMRWMPSSAFFQVLVDMKNAARVTPGVIAAKGHDYRADLLPFFSAVLGLPVTDMQFDAITEWLAHDELRRSEWVKKHGAAGQGLAATILEQWWREQRAQGADVDSELARRVLAAAEAELGAGGGQPGESLK